MEAKDDREFISVHREFISEDCLCIYYLLRCIQDTPEDSKR